MYKINLLSKKNILSGFIRVEELDFSLPEKQTQIKRFVVSRPDAAAIVLYNQEKHSIVLIRQFRAPVYHADENPFIYEIPAGVLEHDEDAKTTIVRETLEETGYQIENPQLIKTIFLSPGILDEKIHLFFATVSDSQKINSGGGLDTEKEFLEVHEISTGEVFNMISDARIEDAKTIIGFLLAKQKSLILD